MRTLVVGTLMAAMALHAMPPQADQEATRGTDVPTAVAELTTAAVSIDAGGRRWQGFFAGSGIVMTAAAPLGGRRVVQLVTSAGRTGLGQVVTVGAEVAVLRVHADLSPGVLVETAAVVPPGTPVQAFLLRHGEAGVASVERVQLTTLRRTAESAVAEISPELPQEAVGAACVDIHGRLLGIVAESTGPVRGLTVALLGDRLSALLADAGRAMEAAATAATAREPARGTPGSEAPHGGSGGASIETESETERRRREGADALGRVLSRLAGQRDEVIRLQSRYDVECSGTTYVPVVTVPGAWPYPGGYLIEKRELPECIALQEQVDGRREALRRNLAEAEERARREGVFPGTVREMKRFYGLDAVR